MPSRRKVLAGSAVILSTTAGCTDLLEGDTAERDGLYENLLDEYGDGERDFNNAMEDFERGNEIFENESYGDAERYFRDASRGFESATDFFFDANRTLRELDDLNSVVGNADTIIVESRDSAIAFSAYADFNQDAAVEAQSNEHLGWIMFDATGETVQQERHPKSLTTRTELMSEFIE